MVTEPITLRRTSSLERRREWLQRATAQCQGGARPVRETDRMQIRVLVQTLSLLLWGLRKTS